MKMVLCFVILVCAQTATIEADQTSSTDAALLAKNGISPTLSGVTSYLRQFKPNASLEKEMARLIQQLGDPIFSVREAAAKRLILMPVVPLKLLRKAALSADRETAFRAKMILNHSTTKEKFILANRRREIIIAVLRVIRKKPIPKSVPLLLEVIPFFDGWDLDEPTADAVAAVAGPSDRQILRESIRSKNTAVRIAAIRGFGNAAGVSARSMLHELCRDRNPLVALAATRALAEQEDRSAFPILIRLTESIDKHVRERSVQVLRALTRQNFGINPYAKIEEQNSNRARWTTWVSGDGRTAKLHVPLKIEPLPENLSMGLLAHYSFDGDAGKKVVDVSGHQRHATAENEFEYKTRVRGKALQLVGSGIHGQKGGHAVLPFIDFSSLKQFSLALWVRESGMSHPQGESYITYGIDRGVGIEDSLGIAHLNSNLIFRVGGGQVLIPYVEADRDRWVHYAMTYRDRLLRTYKNGKLVGQIEAPVKVIGMRAGLGRHWWADGTGTSTRFQGAFDDVRIYDRALSSQQIKMLNAIVN